MIDENKRQEIMEQIGEGTQDTLRDLQEGEPVTVDTENVGEIEGEVLGVGGDARSLKIMDERGQKRGIPTEDIKDINSELF